MERKRLQAIADIEPIKPLRNEPNCISATVGTTNLSDSKTSTDLGPITGKSPSKNGPDWPGQPPPSGPRADRTGQKGRRSASRGVKAGLDWRGWKASDQRSEIVLRAELAKI